MAADALWITEAEVVATIDLAAAMGEVRAVFEMEADGTAHDLAKTATAWDGEGTLHALGGVIEPLGLAGTKSWAHAGGGAAPMLLLWDATSGELRAVIEAFALGQLRTASVSAIATDLLADPRADLMAMIGTGRQALAQVAAVASVRGLRQVRVFSPTAANRAEFCARLRTRLPDTDVVDCEDVAAAVRSAGIVTTATRARLPFLGPEHLLPGTHVNALGAISVERAELTPALVAAASIVVSDSPRAATEQSGEVAGVDVVALSQVLATGRPPPDPRPTVFKAMGLGLADVAVGATVLRLAVERRLGRPVPAAVRRGPSLFAGDHASSSLPGGPP